MKNNLQISLLLLIIVTILYFVNINQQKEYHSDSSSLINFNKEKINKIVINSNVNVLELVKIDTSWIISGHDSLMIKKPTLDKFLKSLSELNIQNTMTSKKEKWHKYNVEDSLGVHLTLIDIKGNNLGNYIFGRSKSDYARCYVRIDKEEEVFLLDNNMMYSLQAIPTYWGEVINNSENKDKLK